MTLKVRLYFYSEQKIKIKNLHNNRNQKHTFSDNSLLKIDRKSTIPPEFHS